MHKISVLMPACNEGAHIYRNIEETKKVLEALGRAYEIIVIDDGSSDNTAAEVARASDRYAHVFLKRNEENRGKGWALKSGFSAASGDLVVFLDADLDLHPRQIEQFLRIREEEGADVVIGSKRHERSVLEYPFQRKLVSTVYFYLVKLLFGLPIRDTQTGLKLFRYEVLERTFHKILVKQWAFDLELLVNAHYLGYEIVEAPVELVFQRPMGRIGLKDLFYSGLDTLAIFYRLKALKFYDRPFERTSWRPMVSVIIPVKKVTPHLVACVTRCQRLDYSDYEILVLPDRDLDLKGERVRVIPTGNVGLSEKKDLGVREARGALLAFLSGDAYPIEDWLSNAVSSFVDDEVVAVWGPEITTPSDPFMRQVTGAVYASAMISGPYVYRYAARRHREVRGCPLPHFVIRKSAVPEVGGFSDAYFSENHGGQRGRLESLLAWPPSPASGPAAGPGGRASGPEGKAKGRILYDPDAMVYCHRPALFHEHLGEIKRLAFLRGCSSKHFREDSLLLVLSLLMVGLLLGWIPGLFFELFLSIYLIVLGGYLAGVLLSAIWKLNVKMGAAVFAGIIATHITYGCWFLKGWMWRRWVRVLEDDERICSGQTR